MPCRVWESPPYSYPGTMGHLSTAVVLPPSGINLPIHGHSDWASVEISFNSMLLMSDCEPSIQLS